jgi:pilus assembly protein TadC
MVGEILMTQDIHVDDFLTIFVSSTLVLVFGGFYVGIYTAVKVKLLKKWAMPFSYLFWILTAYCLYLMGSLMHVNDFTAKALVVAAIGLFLLPHAVYYMQDRVHEENEH